MRFRFAHFRSVLLPLLVAASAGWPCLANAAEATPGARIQFGAPNQSGSATNLNRLATREDSLSPYQPGLLDKAPKVNLGGSMGGVMVIPPGFNRQSLTPAQSKRAKDMLERRKNWALMSPDKFMGDSGEQETIDKLRGSKNREDEDPENVGLTIEQQFLLNLQQEKGDKTPKKKNSRNDKDEEENTRDNQSNPLTEALRESEHALKEQMASGPGQFLLGTPSSGTDLGGLGMNKGEREYGGFFDKSYSAPLPDQQTQQARTQKTRIETWSKEVLGITTPATPDPIQELFRPQTGVATLEMSSSPGINALNMGGLATTPDSFSKSPLSFAPAGNFGLIPSLPAGPSLTPNSLVLPGVTPETPILNAAPRFTPVAPSFTAPNRPF